MKVIIKPEVYAQIDFYVQESIGEVSGLGRVLKHDDGTLEVTKIYLLEQENSAASTDLDAEAVAQLMFESRMDADLGDLNFWWHSHVNMGVFWSGTDRDTIKQFGENGYLLATVFNKKREMKSALYHGATDFLPMCFVDNIPTSVLYEADEATLKEWGDELKTKSKKPIPKAYQSAYSFPLNDGLTDDYGFPVHAHYENSGSKKWKKGKKKKQEKEKKGTLLTGAKARTELDWMQMADTLMNIPEQIEWMGHYAQLKGVDPADVEYSSLVEFYELWEGDFTSMSNHVYTQLAEEESNQWNMNV